VSLAADHTAVSPSTVALEAQMNRRCSVVGEGRIEIKLISNASLIVWQLIAQCCGSADVLVVWLDGRTAFCVAAAVHKKWRSSHHVRHDVHLSHAHCHEQVFRGHTLRRMGQLGNDVFELLAVLGRAVRSGKILSATL
jgi:hypothetical protein